MFLFIVSQFQVEISFGYGYNTYKEYDANNNIKSDSNDNKDDYRSIDSSRKEK